MDIAELTRPGGIVPVNIETTAALVTEVIRLRAALKPFAELGSRFKCLPDDPIWTDTDDGLVAEDFYRASRAYQQYGGRDGGKS